MADEGGDDAATNEEDVPRADNERGDDVAPRNSEEASSDGNATATTEKVQYT